MADRDILGEIYRRATGEPAEWPDDPLWFRAPRMSVGWYVIVGAAAGVTAVAAGSDLPWQAWLPVAGFVAMSAALWLADGFDLLPE